MLRLRATGFSSPAWKDGGFQARLCNACLLTCHGTIPLQGSVPRETNAFSLAHETDRSPGSPAATRKRYGPQSLYSVRLPKVTSQRTNSRRRSSVMVRSLVLIL